MCYNWTHFTRERERERDARARVCVIVRARTHICHCFINETSIPYPWPMPPVPPDFIIFNIFSVHLYCFPYLFTEWIHPWLRTYRLMLYGLCHRRLKINFLFSDSFELRGVCWLPLRTVHTCIRAGSILNQLSQTNQSVKQCLFFKCTNLCFIFYIQRSFLLQDINQY